MAFNELNSVEHFIIHQLSGVDLNKGGPPAVAETAEQGYGAKWRYQSADQLARGVNEVLVESELKATLIRLNPEIAAKPERADEVIYKLRAILISVNQVGLVRANEEFFKWLSGDKTMPFGENNRHVPIRLIDFEDLSNNSYIVTNQFRVHHRETKIPDVVLLLNGMPVVVGEAKTPIRPSVSWLDGAHEIHAIYENAVPQLFVSNILSFATEGKELFYGAIRCPLEFWAPWRLDDESAMANRSALLKSARSCPICSLPNACWTSCKAFRSLRPTRKAAHEGDPALPAIRRRQQDCGARHGGPYQEGTDLAFPRFGKIAADGVCRAKTTPCRLA